MQSVYTDVTFAHHVDADYNAAPGATVETPHYAFTCKPS